MKDKIPRFAVALMFGMASPAFAYTITHTAEVWFCPSVPSVHAICISILENNSGPNPIDLFRRDCRLYRGNIKIASVFSSSPVSGNAEITNQFNKPAVAVNEYCLYNDGRFAWTSSGLNAPGQVSDTDCENFVGGGGPPN
jgi:hypothetical protein